MVPCYYTGSSAVPLISQWSKAPTMLKQQVSISRIGTLIASTAPIGGQQPIVVAQADIVRVRLQMIGEDTAWLIEQPKRTHYFVITQLPGKQTNTLLCWESRCEIGIGLGLELERNI